MRLSLSHTETFTYEQPPLGILQVLRLTPRDFDGHYVCDWTVDVDADCQVDTKKDAFGNIVTSFSLHGPFETLTVTARGDVETDNTHGIVRGTVEKVPSGVFLRPTGAERDAAAARMLVQTQSGTTLPPLERMHALMGALHEALPEPADQTEEDGSDETAARSRNDQAQQSQNQNQNQRGQTQAQPPKTAPAPSPASPSPATRRLAGLLAERTAMVPTDAASILAEAARHYGLPARLVEGYRLAPGEHTHAMAHRNAWCEVLIDGLGWIGFDAVDKSCPSEDSVRVAIGLDAPSVAAVRAGHYGAEPVCKRETVIALSRIGG